MKIKDLVEHLQKNFPQDGECGFFIWAPSDVLMLSREMKVVLSLDDCVTILKRLTEENKDPQGQSWGLLCKTIKEFVKEKNVSKPII